MDRGDIVSLLQSEAKRRPKVAALLARAHILTDVEIDNADVPLKWFKQALREARAREQHRMEMERLDAIMGPDIVIEGANARPGRRIAYMGLPFFARSCTGMDVEIKTNDWFFLPEDCVGAWQNQTFFNMVPAQVLQFSTELVADETRHDYVIAWAEELSRRY